MIFRHCGRNMLCSFSHHLNHLVYGLDILDQIFHFERIEQKDNYFSRSAVLTIDSARRS